MSKEILVLEQHSVEIGGKTFLITAFDAVYGMKVMGQLATHQGESMTNPDFVKGMVLKATKVDNKQMTSEWFDKYFSKKYEQLFQLVQEIIAFNFGDMSEDPNGEGDTSEV